MSGFGLQTPRGTGTSGYLQKSATEKRLSGFREKRDREALEQERREKRARMSQARFEASADLRNFNRKREIEVKCMELRESLEEQDLSDSEIDKKVKSLRQSLSGENKQVVLERSDDPQEDDEKSHDDDKPQSGNHFRKNQESQNYEATSGEFVADSVHAKSPSGKNTSTSKTPLSQAHTTSNEEIKFKPKKESSVFAYVPRYSNR